MKQFASASGRRRSLVTRLVVSIRRHPVRWFVALGAATALACGGAGGGSGASTPYIASRVVFTANIASSLRFAPDGRIFFTELKTGKVRIVQNGVLVSGSFAILPIATDNEQGLLGLALDPDYANNKFVYVFYTQASPLKQRIVRFTDDNNVGTNMTTIVDDLPVFDHHCGGRIGFGSDGKLYVTVGDVGDPANSQNDAVTSGKLLRYEPNGSPAAGNPTNGNPLYAKGLRNAFGLTFHPTSGRPYVSENGPSCDDEVNRIVAGGNYGWRPNQPCNDVDVNYILPIVKFTPCIAPTGVTFYTGTEFPEFFGDLLMGSFNDGRLRRFRVDDSANNPVLEQETIIANRTGGVIDVTQGTDGGIYFCDGTGIYRLVRA